MLSNLLGLTIDKSDLNKSSPSPVVSTLKKTAINYLAIGKMAEDLKLIKLNFSRYLAMEGVKVRGTPDMHFLKDDERTKKFNVLREKQVQSKISAGAKDGTSGNKGWAKTLIAGFIGYKVSRKFERNLSASVLKRYRKLTAIRQLIRFKRKIIIGLKKLLDKINIKKMFLDWFKTNKDKIMKPLIEMFTNAVKRFVKKGLTKLIQRATVSILASIWSGPFMPIVAGIILLGLTLWEPIKEAWEAYTKGEDFIDVFIVSVIDSITFGIFGKENIKNFKDSIANWLDTMAKKVFETIDKATKYIKEKTTKFVDFLINKGKALLAPNDKPEKFVSALDELNAKKVQEHNEMLEKYNKYFEEMNVKIEKSRIRIAQLKVEIAVLESEIKGLTEGPEKARLEEVKVEKAKEEQKLVEQEIELEKSRKGGGPIEETKPVVKKSVATKKEETKPTPTVKIKEETKPTSASPQVLAPAPTVKKKEETKPTPSSGSGGVGGAEKAILDEIAKHESETSGGYNAMNQGTIGKKIVAGHSQKIIGKNLIDMTVGEVIDRGAKPSDNAEKRKNEGLIFAAGRYQIIPVTLATLVKNGVVSRQDKFDEKSQDKLCIALLELRGLAKYKQGKISAETFQNNLAKEWASLPTTKGVSFYHKPGQNVAGKGADQGLKNAIASITPAEETTGTKLASTEPKPTTTAASGKFLKDESKQVAQAQREQMKPKDVNVADASKTNNVKKTNYQNVAMGDKPDLGSEMAKRAA